MNNENKNMTAPTPEQMRALADASEEAIEEDDWAWKESARTALRAAADEVDRLRAVIDNAPHAPSCVDGLTDRDGSALPCDCWKADAL